MKARASKDPSVRLEITIALVVLSFAAGIAVGAWMESDLTNKAQRTTEGIVNLVGNLRQQLENKTFSPGTGYEDVTDRLREHDIVPPTLLRQGKLASAWDNPMNVAINRGSAIPVIEISISEMSARSCKRLVSLLSRRYYNVSDLRSIWVGPPGVTLSKFPVSPEQTGCTSASTKITFQYQLQGPRR